MGPLRIRLGVILAFTGVFSLSFTATPAKETATGQAPASPSGEYAINEDTALDLVWDVPYLTEFKTENPDARLVLMVTGTPAEEDGRWYIKAMTDEGTHYSTVDIYYVDATTGTVTAVGPVTGEKFFVDEG